VPSNWEKAHIEAHDHLIACISSVLDEDETIEDPSSAPFCGCEVCVVREVLYAACPFLEKHFGEEA